MVIPSLDEAPTRAVRREETARLLGQASKLKGRRRDQVIDQVIVLNIGVAHAIAHRYRNRSVPVEDLEQVACMALVRAAQKFDVDQNRDFLTYAVPTISGEIKRHFRDQGWTIRPPRRVQEIQSKVIHAYHRGEEHGAPPSADRIAEQLDAPRLRSRARVTVPRRSRQDGSVLVDDRGRPERADAHVWHCSLALHPDEPDLSDERSAEICEQFVAEMGFAGQRAQCRWVAMRHGRSTGGSTHMW
jgi:RNA polymerase sigma factor (sigma-70 family)